jgi:hypothetical protein
VTKVERDARELCREGWLIPMDVASTIEATQQSAVP